MKKRLLQVFFHRLWSRIQRMKKWRELIIVSLTWLFFLICHLIFTKYFLYWTLWWLDIFMHTFGAGLIIYTWFSLFKLTIFSRLFSSSLLHPILVLSYLMIGWEVFEYLIGNANINRGNYILDTTIDLLVGLSSGLITFWLLKSRTITK